MTTLQIIWMVGGIVTIIFALRKHKYPYNGALDIISIIGLYLCWPLYWFMLLLGECIVFFKSRVRRLKMDNKYIWELRIARVDDEFYFTNLKKAKETFDDVVSRYKDRFKDVKNIKETIIENDGYIIFIMKSKDIYVKVSLSRYFADVEPGDLW